MLKIPLPETIGTESMTEFNAESDNTGTENTDTSSTRNEVQVL